MAELNSQLNAADLKANSVWSHFSCSSPPSTAYGLLELGRVGLTVKKMLTWRWPHIDHAVHAPAPRLPVWGRVGLTVKQRLTCRWLELTLTMLSLLQPSIHCSKHGFHRAGLDSQLNRGWPVGWPVGELTLTMLSLLQPSIHCTAHCLYRAGLDSQFSVKVLLV